jgi:hypothetical protein
MTLSGMPAQAKPHPTPTPTATPTPGPEDPAITAIVRREFLSWQTGTVDKSHYSADAGSKLNPDDVEKMSKALGTYGALQGTTWLGKFQVVDGPAGVQGYTYRMDCSIAPVFVQLMIEPNGLVDSINFLKQLPGT